jgi:3-methylcrotonyl-CoA carboxylase alpha subunit
LASTELAGVEHNVAFLRRVLAHGDFRSGDYTTHLLDIDDTLTAPARGPVGLVCAALAFRAAVTGSGRWNRADGFRVNRPSVIQLRLRRDDADHRVALGTGWVEIDEVRMGVEVHGVDVGSVRCQLDGEVVQARVVLSGDSAFVMRAGDTERVVMWQPDVAALAEAAGAGERIAAPMPGQVIAVSAKPGDRVAAGQVLAVIEAMKMEHAVLAPRDGVVATVACTVGDRVDDGVELVTLEED